MILYVCYQTIYPNPPKLNPTGDKYVTYSKIHLLNYILRLSRRIVAWLGARRGTLLSLPLRCFNLLKLSRLQILMPVTYSTPHLLLSTPCQSTFIEDLPSCLTAGLAG